VKVASVKAKELDDREISTKLSRSEAGAKSLDNTHPVSLSAPPRQDSVWTPGVCPATGRKYWFKPGTEESTYEDPTVGPEDNGKAKDNRIEYSHGEAKPKFTSRKLPLGGGRGAPMSSSLNDILRDRRERGEQRRQRRRNAKKQK
jgi:hypothetical protein